MEDKLIVDLYWARSEDALSETSKKYGKYCFYIANNILHSRPDSEECVNDAYVKAWSSIPPAKPEKLSAFLGRIVRNLALNRYEYEHAKKRSSNMSDILDEARIFSITAGLEEQITNSITLKETVNGFFSTLDKEARTIFVRRYWYMSSVKDISKDYGIPAGTVKSILFRTREKLKKHLQKEGFDI